jgi:hypothetical protein
MIDYVSKINDNNAKVPTKLKNTLNKFFNDVGDSRSANDCIIRDGKSHGYPDATIVLIIESSDMYYYISGVFGWAIHTKFMNSFKKTGFCPDMINSGIVGFYKTKS